MVGEGAQALVVAAPVNHVAVGTATFARLPLRGTPRPLRTVALGVRYKQSESQCKIRLPRLGQETDRFDYTADLELAVAQPLDTLSSLIRMSNRHVKSQNS